MRREPGDCCRDCSSCRRSWPGRLRLCESQRSLSRQDYRSRSCSPWYHGDRGHQRLAGVEVAILTVLLLLGGGATWWFGRPPAATLATQATAPERSGSLDGKSIAVLPFANLGDDPQQEFFSDGLADTLIQQLSQVRELKVIARSSSFRYKGRNLDLREVGRELGVGAILDGSVQRSGKRVRVNAQLVNVRDGSNFWSKSFDREADDIFGIQDEIAGDVFNALKLILLSNAMNRQVVSPYRNLDAYDAYLRGRAGLERRTGESLQQAAAAFTRATDLDPDYALAYVGLANTVVFLAQRQLLTDQEANTRASTAVERALTLDPNLGEAYAARAPLQIRQEISGCRAVVPESHRTCARLRARLPLVLGPPAVAGSLCRRRDDGKKGARAGPEIANLAYPVGLDPRESRALRGGLSTQSRQHRDRPRVRVRVWRSLGVPREGRATGRGGTVAAQGSGDRSGQSRRAVRHPQHARADRSARACAPETVRGCGTISRGSMAAGDARAPRVSQGRLPGGSRHAKLAMGRDAADAYAMSVIVECLLAQGRVDAALQFVRQAAPGLFSDPREWSRLSSGAAGVAVARVLMRSGDIAAARALLGESIASLRDESRGDDPAPGWWLVIAYATLDDRKATLTELKRIVDDGRFWGWSVLLEPNALAACCAMTPNFAGSSPGCSSSRIKRAQAWTASPNCLQPTSRPRSKSIVQADEIPATEHVVLRGIRIRADC